MQWNVAIVEDNHKHRVDLQKMLHTWAKKNQTTVLCDCYCDGADFLADKEGTEAYDVVFLDIFMLESNGMDIAKKIREEGDSVAIVFISSSFDYALEGYNVDAINYIVKPVCPADIERCMRKAAGAALRRNDMSFLFKHQGATRHVLTSDILYFKSRDHYITMYCKAKTYEFRENLREVAAALPDQFIQCSKSVIVNIYAVNALYSREIALVDGTRFAIGDKYFYNVTRKYMQLFTLESDD